MTEPFSNIPADAEIVANHQLSRGPSGTYIVRSFDGLRTIGEYSRRTQAEQACHLAAAYAKAEQRRIADEQAAALVADNERIGRGERRSTARGGFDD